MSLRLRRVFPALAVPRSRHFGPLRALALAGALMAGRSTPALAAEPAPAVEISTSLPVVAQREPARALDGDPATYFTSGRPARDGDDFLVTLPAPTRLRSLHVLTGKADGANRLDFGVLEVSADGTNFTHAATFADGEARAIPPTPNAALIRAARVRVTGGGSGNGVQPLSIREFTLEPADPGVHLPTARLVTRIEVDWSHADQCAAFGRRTREIVREWYPRLRERLASAGDPPQRSVIRIHFLPMDGVAYATDGEIRIAADWVTKKAPNDYGMVVHELTHIVQAYDGGGEGWLTEGIADYIRDFVYEPGFRTIQIDPDKASYRDAYTTTAAFLDWLVRVKDPGIVTKLNAASRERRPIPTVFREAAGKDLDALWHEFTDTLRKPAKP